MARQKINKDSPSERERDSQKLLEYLDSLLSKSRRCLKLDYAANNCGGEGYIHSRIEWVDEVKKILTLLLRDRMTPGKIIRERKIKLHRPTLMERIRGF
jgi:hypothetical protein